MRRVPFEIAFIAALDALIGLAYLLLDRSYFSGVGIRIPRSWWPLPVWGVLYLLVAAGVVLFRSTGRRAALVLGVMVNAAFALALLVAFRQGFRNPDRHLHSSPVGALLLLGWAARHLLTGQRTTAPVPGTR